MRMPGVFLFGGIVQQMMNIMDISNNRNHWKYLKTAQRFWAVFLFVSKHEFRAIAQVDSLTSFLSGLWELSGLFARMRFFCAVNCRKLYFAIHFFPYLHFAKRLLVPLSRQFKCLHFHFYSCAPLHMTRGSFTALPYSMIVVTSLILYQLLNQHGQKLFKTAY